MVTFGFGTGIISLRFFGVFLLLRKGDLNLNLPPLFDNFLRLRLRVFRVRLRVRLCDRRRPCRGAFLLLRRGVSLRRRRVCRRRDGTETDRGGANTIGFGRIQVERLVTHVVQQQVAV